jgi:uncharacterized membrane protein YraQ (UPF0718 family)
MNSIFQLVMDTVVYVAGTLIHNAPILILGIVVAAALSVYVDADKFRQVLMSKSIVSIPATVAFGAFTPFCACGTMAVVVAMLTTALPWGPIMAFLTSSPLMGPDDFIFISGIISVKFAVALTIASLVIGLGAGFATQYIEKRTHFLDGQARFGKNTSGKITGCTDCSEACCCDEAVETGVIAAAVGGLKAFLVKYKVKEFLRFCFDVGVKQILIYFAVFAAVGYLINRYVPAELITRYLGGGNLFAVPLLALVGLPLYVTGPSSLPVISALMSSGASGGALLAFMITGPGTSAGVIAGIAMIMKRRAIALYVGFLMAGAILLGYLYDLYLFLS